MKEEVILICFAPLICETQDTSSLITDFQFAKRVITIKIRCLRRKIRQKVRIADKEDFAAYAEKFQGFGDLGELLHAFTLKSVLVLYLKILLILKNP